MRSVQHAIPYLPLHLRQAEEPALNQVLLMQLQSRLLVPGTEALPTVILPVLTPDRLAKLQFPSARGAAVDTFTRPIYPAAAVAHNMATTGHDLRTEDFIYASA